LRWVPPPNLHLTLRFLGPVRREAVEAIERKLAAELAALRPFELEARGLGGFPSLAEPRVLWIGVREEPALVALQQAIEGWLAELGFPREERPYRPHITIGRVTGNPVDLGPLVFERGSRGYGTGRVSEVIVFESRTLSKGSEYHPLGRARIGR
jgi:2'-5' RNA ligase